MLNNNTMGLPFKNGFELAKAMGFGKMYQASKQQQENNVQMESKKTNSLIRITESDLHNMVKESVNKILTELDWKTYMNASRRRKLQGDEFRGKFPHTSLGHERNSFDDKADDLESAAQRAFQMKHGKNGTDHNYEGDSPSFGGRRDWNSKDRGDRDFDVKNAPSKTWDDGLTQTKYRFGKGVPHRNYGEVHDDTLDYFTGSDDDDKTWFRKHTMRYNQDGEKYDPYNSSVGDEISISQDKDYNARQDAMSKDMNDYYTGKSKYTKGKGWK